MTPLPRTAQDDADDYRRFFTPTPSLPEELARPTLSIAAGCPDATAWDEDEGRIVLPAHLARYARELIGRRYLTSAYHAQAVALVLCAARRDEHGLPPMTALQRERLCAAATMVYQEQRAEYLLDWSPTIPDSERAA